MALFIKPNELKSLILYAEKAKLGIVEIGTLDGESAAYLAENAAVPVYSIDPIIPDSMWPSLIGSEQSIRDNTKHLANFHFIKDYSYNVAPGWNKEFDFLFIDGDHEYDAVKKDYDDWFPLLAKGGILAFHDSAIGRGEGTYGWPGPTQFADELIASGKGLRYIETVGSLTVFMKIR